MLSWSTGRMLRTLLNDGLEVASVKSSVVGEAPGQQAVRISNVIEVGEVEYCTSPFLPCKRPARVSVLKALERGNRKIKKHPPKLQSSVALSFTMSRWCCPGDGSLL